MSRLQCEEILPIFFLQIQESISLLNTVPDLVTSNTHNLLPFHASDIERYSRIVFPLLFITFHLVYWTLLLKMTDTHLEDLVPLKVNNVLLPERNWKCSQQCFYSILWRNILYQIILGGILLVAVRVTFGGQRNNFYNGRYFHHW